MHSNSQRISNTQIKKLLVFDMLSISIIILPGVASGGAGRDGLPAIILGSLAALVYCLFFLYIVNRINESYIDFSKKAVGKLPAFIIGILYITKIIFSCWFTLALFAKVINDTLLPDTNIKIIIASLILVSIYAAGKGIEVRARLAEVFFYIVIAPLILLMLLGLKRVELTNLFPLFTGGGRDILYTSYSVLLVYSAIDILIFALPGFSDHKNKKDRSKNVIQSVLFVAAINILLFILVLGLLGITGAQRQFKSSILIMQLIQIPGGFVQRQDAIMLTIWMLSVFIILSAYFYYLSYITNSLIRVKRRYCNLLIWMVWAALLFGLSCVDIPIESLFLCYGKYMAYIGFPQSVIIPLFVIIMYKLRSGRGGEYESR